MKHSLLGATLLLAAIPARADDYNPPLDSFVVSFGPVCSPADTCAFDESWQLNVPDGLLLLLGTALPLPNGVPAPVPGLGFSIITTISDFFPSPDCGSNEFQCALEHVFPNGQEFPLPHSDVVNAAYLTWLSVPNPRPVSVDEPSTGLLLGTGTLLSLLYCLFKQKMIALRHD